MIFRRPRETCASGLSHTFDGDPSILGCKPFTCDRFWPISATCTILPVSCRTHKPDELPRAALKNADRFATVTIKHVTDSFATSRRKLESEWNRDDGAWLVGEESRERARTALCTSARRLLLQSVAVNLITRGRAFLGAAEPEAPAAMAVVAKRCGGCSGRLALPGFQFPAGSVG